MVGGLTQIYQKGSEGKINLSGLSLKHIEQKNTKSNNKSCRNLSSYVGNAFSTSLMISTISRRRVGLWWVQPNQIVSSWPWFSEPFITLIKWLYGNDYFTLQRYKVLRMTLSWGMRRVPSKNTKCTFKKILTHISASQTQLTEASISAHRCGSCVYLHIKITLFSLTCSWHVFYKLSGSWSPQLE